MTKRKKQTRASNKPPPKRGYHHGNLRQALIDAAVDLISEQGPEGIATRSVARRAGVSSAAPFRHFDSRRGLMTAIAEEGIAQLSELTREEMRACTREHPLVRLMAFARAYVNWFLVYPVHYRVVADRPRIDFDSSEALISGTQWIRQEMSALFNDAGELGFFGERDPEEIHLHMRALAYGLGRMQVDDHLREWAISKKQAPTKILSILQESLIAQTVRPKTVRRILS